MTLIRITKTPKRERQKVERQKWFTTYAYDTLSVLSLSCSIMGLVGLGMEVVMWALVGQTPAQVMQWPLPFVSLPLGVGAVGITTMIFWVRRELALLSGVGVLTYWSVVAGLWFGGFLQ